MSSTSHPQPPAAAAPVINFVVPCYNEQEVLPVTVARLLAVLDDLRQVGLASASSQIVFVDDGSADATWSIIDSLCRSEPRIRGLKLSRNRGHQNALLAGLHHAACDAAISIDADLQDDLAVIPEMIRAFVDGNDIVYGVRGDRSSDSLFKRWTAEGYYGLLRRLGVNVVYNHADYRLMSRRSIEALRQFTEVNLFLRGVIPLLGYRTTLVYYKRLPRQAGVSKYPFTRMVALAVNGVTSFSAAPLRFITTVGIVTSGISAAIAIWALWTKLILARAIPGWTSTVVPLLLLGGVQLFATGVIGEYVARIYLETKRRPLYIVEHDLNGAAPARIPEDPLGDASRRGHSIAAAPSAS